MIKKYSCKEFSIEADFDFSLTYVGAMYGHFAVKGLKITNTSGRDWKTMTVALTGDYIKTQIKVHDGVANGDMVEITPDRPETDMDRLGRIDTSRSSEIRVSVSGDNETFGVMTLPLRVYNRNHFAGETGHFEDLAAFVAPGHELVGRITESVKDDGIGENDDEFAALRERVGKIYNALKALEIDYRDVFFMADKGQDINTCDQIEKEQSGNGLDIALLMCACLERMGVRTSLIYFNSSVIVGAWVQDAPAPDSPVLTDAEDIYGLIAADRPLLVLADPVGIATGKDFEDSNYSANKLLLGEDPRYLIDIKAAREAGVKPLAAPQKSDESSTTEPVEEADGNCKELLGGLVARNKTLPANMAASGLIGPTRADSFAIKAITEAERGVSFVLDAPAGTDKDDVVASIIANASAKGKRVRYIAADEETKDGVRRCLERISPDNHDYKQIGYPEKERELLETAFEATHRKGGDGLSVNDMVERYFAIDGDEMHMSESKATRIDESHAAEIADTLASLDDFTRIFGKHPSKLPLTGIYPRVKTSRGQARIEAFIEEFPRFEKRVRRRERGLLNRWLFHHDAMHYLERIEQWNTFRRLVVLDDKLTANIDTISEAMSRWHANRHLFADWEPYAEAVVSLNRLGALGTLDYFLTGNSGKAAADAFLKGFYKAKVTHAIKKGGLLHELSSEKCEAAAEKCCASVLPGMKCVDMGYVEMLTADRNGDSKHTDILIIDNVGRIPSNMIAGLVPADAQTILVGDTVMADRTSALVAAVDAGLPEYDLKYLIRPRHERLVAFRNKTFYDGNLFTFPSADDRRSAVRHVDPSGCFDAETQTNEVEAQAVVDMVSHYLGRKGEALTVGVVAFTQAQCELIDSLWKENHASMQSKPLFIRTLETMTGAEVCDVLVLSVTYAPDNRGLVRAEFGCLENRDGEQLLNRAISSVCRELAMVSSLRPSHIPEDEAMSYGARVLRRFIAYSIDPYRPLRGETDKIEVSATIKSMAAALESRGHEVATNVGEGPFKVDLAVKDPTESSCYMFGVIVDGKNSESLPVETDRDVVVPEILSGLGWKIKRIRAVDWFADREAVMARLLTGADR